VWKQFWKRHSKVAIGISAFLGGIFTAVCGIRFNSRATRRVDDDFGELEETNEQLRDNQSSLDDTSDRIDIGIGEQDKIIKRVSDSEQKSKAGLEDIETGLDEQQEIIENLRSGNSELEDFIQRHS
jgi:septal ring factor EnvC (AmiA/AmiB activator)